MVVRFDQIARVIAPEHMICCCHVEMIADAHRDEKRFVVRADEKLAAFMELI